MADAVNTDSHESNSMARPVSSASVDGWDVESSSADQPSSEQLAERLRDEPTTPGAEPDEPKASADADDDDDDDAPDRETPAGEPEHPKKKKLTAAERKAVLQAEFNALTRQREDARRAFEAEEADRQRKRAERDAAPKAAAPEEKVPATKAEASALPADDGPDWDEYEARGETFSKYQKDRATFERAEAAKAAREAATSVVTSMLASSRERELAAAEEAREDARREAAAQKYPDWAEKIAANLEGVPQTPFMATVVRRHPAGMDLLYTLADHPAEAKILATLPMTRPIMDVVKESSDPAPLLLYFARHPEEHSRIAHLDPPRQLLALGRLSAELSPEDAKTGSSSPTPPVTSARPPIRPVGAGRSAGGARGDDEDLDFGPEYVRRQNEARLARLHR